MNTKLYVGNLSVDFTEAALRELFSQSGSVSSARLILDKITGKPRGFGFLEMSTASDARQSIAARNGREIDGQALTVSLARPQAARPNSR
jgi:RNA recognition motif-containing protein